MTLQVQAEKSVYTNMRCKPDATEMEALSKKKYVDLVQRDVI